MLDPYIDIHVLGAPGARAREQDKKEAKEFYQWIQNQGFSMWRWREDINDINAIMQGFKEWSFHDTDVANINEGWFRGMDSETRVDFNPSAKWRLPGDNISGQALYSWKSGTQRTFHGGTRPLDIDRHGKPQKITLPDYNSLAQDAKNLAFAIHQKLGAKLSWVDYAERLPRPYPKTMPLWIGWSTIVGKVVREKYRLDERLSKLPGSIKLERQGNDLVFTSTQPYSEYVLNGWDEEAKAFWEKVGGKLILPKGKKRSRGSRKGDGKTYIVDTDKEGDAVLKPFNFPGT